MKKWYQSKTVIFNIIALVVLVLSKLVEMFEIPANLESVFVAIVSGGNFILRFLTNTGIGNEEK